MNGRFDHASQADSPHLIGLPSVEIGRYERSLILGDKTIEKEDSRDFQSRMGSNVSFQKNVHIRMAFYQPQELLCAAIQAAFNFPEESLGQHISHVMVIFKKGYNVVSFY